MPAWRDRSRLGATCYHRATSPNNGKIARSEATAPNRHLRVRWDVDLCLINAGSAEVGTGTNLSGLPTSRDLATLARFVLLTVSFACTKIARQVF